MIIDFNALLKDCAFLVGWLLGSLLLALVVGLLNVEIINYLFKIFPDRSVALLFIEYIKKSKSDNDYPERED